MRFAKSDGVVLSARRWSESSYILDLLTAGYGKVSIVSRGARRPKAFAGAAHRTGSNVEAVWIDNAGQDLFTGVSLDEIPPTVALPNYSSLSHAAMILQIVRRTANRNEMNSAGYHQLVRSLHRISICRSPERLVWQFAIRWAAQMGFNFEMTRCAFCGAPLTGRTNFYFPEEGAFAGAECAHHDSSHRGAKLEANGETIAILRRLEELPELRLDSLKVSPIARDQITAIIQSHFHFHTGHFHRVTLLAS